ncbi:MAG: trypsin-like serine protease, partial [Natronospirillum sp.]
MNKCLWLALLWLCSLSAGSMILVEPRIVGGTAVTDPPDYLVFLVVETPSGSQWCGGSYVGEGRVLTAAHCLFGDQSSPATNIQLYFNVPSGNRNNLRRATRIDSSVYSIYPEYNNATFGTDPAGDAAVVFLPRAVPAGVQAI